MEDFFKVKSVDQVLEYVRDFTPVDTEQIPLSEAVGRILAADIRSDMDLPEFSRSVMDGYALRAASSFGASEANPAYLSVKGSVAMGEPARFSAGPGEAVRISTGGMLPEDADSVVMLEHAQPLDETTIEIYRSVAPGQNIVAVGEDFKKGERILCRGQRLRPQETGLLAAFGHRTITVFKKALVSIISTGDEIVPIDIRPGPGKIRDINTYTLSGLVRQAGGVPLAMGIIRDNYDALLKQCLRALAESDMVLISGGSSVGVRDYSIEVLSALPQSRILVHGISISPGKPTILAQSEGTAIWGLPGHVVSSMVVFHAIVRPFLDRINGLADSSQTEPRRTALLSRNIASAQGRVDYVRVRLRESDGIVWAEPVLGKSALINTMVKADGLIAIGLNTEGLDRGSPVEILPL